MSKTSPPSIAERWTAFFHTPVDDRTYAGLRIGFGILLLLKFLVLGPDWIRWFGEEGIVPREIGEQSIDPDTWSVFFWIPATPQILWTIYGIILAQVLALTLGYRPRLQAACLFIWMLSLQHRNNLIWDGEDILFRVTCFLLIWMPLGRVWAIDPLNRQTADRDPAPSAWALRLLQLQLAILYLSAFLSKMSGPHWRDGTAVWYVMHLDEFSGKLPFLSGLFEMAPVYTLLTWFTIVMELLLVFGPFRKDMRVPVVLLGLLFHLGLELNMYLFLFQWLMMLILVTHLKPEDWQRFRDWLRKRKPGKA